MDNSPGDGSFMLRYCGLVLRAELFAELFSGQYVEVQVLHRLPGVLAAVVDDTKACV